MTRPYFAASGPPMGSLLQKAAVLLLAIGLSSPAPHGGAATGTAWASSASEVRGVSMFAGGCDFQTLGSMDEEQREAAGLSRATDELAIAKRLLQAIASRQQPDTSDLDYMARLDEVFRFAEQHQHQLGAVAGTLADHLQVARVELLEGAQSVRDWTLIARAVNPSAQLRVPHRFYGPRIKHGHGIDTGAIEAGAWARSLVS